MTIIKRTEIFIARNLFVVLLTFKITSSTGQVTEKSDNIIIENDVNTQALILNQSTTFPQIHTNLNGMVREFVRTMYQDKKGNYWFGTNGNGIIRYDGQTLQKISIEGLRPLKLFMKLLKTRLAMFGLQLLLD
jgi:ligand-binding sensor domain-containing protein